jgi:hypothetical protein
LQVCKVFFYCFLIKLYWHMWTFHYLTSYRSDMCVWQWPFLIIPSVSLWMVF